MGISKKRWEMQKLACELKYARLWHNIWKRVKIPLLVVVSVAAFLALSIYIVRPFMIKEARSYDPLFGSRGGLLVPDKMRDDYIWKPSEYEYMRDKAKNENDTMVEQWELIVLNM